MTDVYAWPPVGVIGSEWTTSQPVSLSRSMLTGKRYVSQLDRERRLARLDVSSLAKPGAMGAGYMEVLKRLLAGGVGLVRLYSYPINWHLDALAEAGSRSAYPVGWETDTDPSLVWVGPKRWFDGTLLEGTPGTSGAWDIVTVTGLPPSQLVARPGEFLTRFASLTDTVGETVMIQAPAYSDATGEAVIRVMAAISASGRANIGGSDTGVFEALGMPRAMQPIGADWTYSWEFREVFSDEVAGGFTEVDPWN